MCHTEKSRFLDEYDFANHNAWEALHSCVQSEYLFLSLSLLYLLRWAVANIIGNKGVYILICLYHSSQHSETPFKHPFSLVKGDHLKTNRPHKKSRVSKFL